ncbi:preprotein translocase subunit SecG [Phaeocystidibacter luteus]
MKIDYDKTIDMLLVVSILIALVCVLLVLIILVQKPKGGGLGSSFGGSANMLGGVQKTNQFLDKATWGLAIALLVLVLTTNLGAVGDSVQGQEAGTSVIQSEDVQNQGQSFSPVDGAGTINTQINTEDQQEPMEPAE